MKKPTLKVAVYGRFSSAFPTVDVRPGGPGAKQKKRAQEGGRDAIYLRGSDASSIKRQLRVCRSIARRRKLGPAVYSDLSQSSTSTCIRPGLEQLMRDAAAGRFKHIVVESADRLSRDFLTMSKFIRQLESYGVRVQNADGSNAVATITSNLMAARCRLHKRKPGN